MSAFATFGVGFLMRPLWALVPARTSINTGDARA
jgi:hypothetical protein